MRRSRVWYGDILIMKCKMHVLLLLDQAWIQRWVSVEYSEVGSKAVCYPGILDVATLIDACKHCWGILDSRTVMKTCLWTTCLKISPDAYSNISCPTRTYLTTTTHWKKYYIGPIQQNVNELTVLNLKENIRWIMLMFHLCSGSDLGTHYHIAWILSGSRKSQTVGVFEYLMFVRYINQWFCFR